MNLKMNLIQHSMFRAVHSRDSLSHLVWQSLLREQGILSALQLQQNKAGTYRWRGGPNTPPCKHSPWPLWVLNQSLLCLTEFPPNSHQTVLSTNLLKGILLCVSLGFIRSHNISQTFNTFFLHSAVSKRDHYFFFKNCMPLNGKFL